MSERIQKVLADAGVASRRAVERWVTEGRITVDGRVARIGEQLNGHERVCVDGRPVRLRTVGETQRQFLAYYTPGASRERPGPTSADGRAGYTDLPRPKRGRWIDIAPLDPNASGLLVLTTDGELAHRLMRPSAPIEREYAVRVPRELSPAQLQGLTTGVELEDGLAKVDSVAARGGTGQNSWYHVVLHDSRHRKLRAAFTGIGATIGRVIRVRYGPVELGRLRRGAHRALTPDEVAALYAAAGLKPPAAEATARSHRPKRRAFRSARSPQ